MNNINAFWFRHDNAARSDIKVGQLRHKYGRGAYEVFFMLLEILHATGTGYIEYDIPALAYEMREEEEFVQKIIEYAITIGLICEQDGKIFTRRIVSEISERKEYLAQQRKKSKLGVAARVRGKSGQPTGQPTGIPKGQPADDPKKERKAKESKGDEVKLESNTLSVNIINEENVCTITKYRDELSQLVTWLYEKKIFPDKKVITKKTVEKWRARRRVYLAQDLAKALANTHNEPDHWKLRHNAGRPLSWWLKSDDYIEELLTCHLKDKHKRDNALSTTRIS